MICVVDTGRTRARSEQYYLEAGSAAKLVISARVNSQMKRSIFFFFLFCVVLGGGASPCGCHASLPDEPMWTQTM
jgi:hypothetical protein